MNIELWKLRHRFDLLQPRSLFENHDYSELTRVVLLCFLHPKNKKDITMFVKSGAQSCISFYSQKDQSWFLCVSCYRDSLAFGSYAGENLEKYKYYNNEKQNPQSSDKSNFSARQII